MVSVVVEGLSDAELMVRHRRFVRDCQDCLARTYWRELLRRRRPDAVRHLGCRYRVTEFYLQVAGEMGYLILETRAGEAAEREVIRQMRKKKGVV